MLNHIKRFWLHLIGPMARCIRLCLHWKESRVGAVFVVCFTVVFSPPIMATGKTTVVGDTQTRGATLEIDVTKLAQSPVLFFLQSKNSRTKNTLSRADTPVHIAHAQIVSHMTQFDPLLQVLAVGTTLDVVNRDPILHNTHVFSGSRTVFNVATPNTDIAVQRTFSHPGLFAVRCDLHPSMNAWIAVVSDANYAVIDSPGVYRIENIEPGRYQVHIQRPQRKDQILEMELAAAEEKKIQLPP